jgi:hypothetical protein
MSKRYRLKKEMPMYQVGEIFRWHKMTGGYRPDESFFPNYEESMRHTLSKQYVEDSPDWFELIKEEPKEVFTWDDTDWHGIIYNIKKKDHPADWLIRQLNIVLQSKQSKTSPLQSKPDTSKERIEVSDVRVLGNSDHGHWYEFHVAGTGQNYLYDIPTDKLPLIQQAIEAAINSEYQVHPDSSWSIHSRNEKLYTQQQMDKAREQTWMAAKDTIPDPSGLFQLVYKYPTLQSYLNTLK